MKIISSPLFILLLLLCAACQSKPKETPEKKKAAAIDTLARMPEQMASNSYAAVDISPMDMSYFPVDYPKLKMTNGNMAPPVVRVVYSRPHLQRRRLFPGILKYEEPWRLGANESTEIDFYKAVTIQGKKVAVGRYILYCIPHEGSWTIVLNSNIDTWGLKQDPAKDIQRFDISVTSDNPMLEYFTMVFEKTDTGADLVMGWDDVMGKLPISF